MKIFPEVAMKYVRDSDSTPMSRFGDFVLQSLQLNESWWVAANLDQRYEAGDQQLWQQYYNAWQVRANKQFTFNLIRPQVAALEGYQRAHRKSTIVVPREHGSQETADQFTQLLLWINQQEKYYETLSSSFRGALITGMNLMQAYMDFRKDPINGDIKYSSRPYNSILIDPYFTKMDLSDCQGIVTRSFVTPLEAASFLPDFHDDIMGLEGFGPAEATFQFMPQNYQFAYNNLLTYDEFYYPALRVQRLVVDTKTGETAEWKDSDDAKLRAFLQAYPELKLVKQSIPTVRLTILVQGKVLFDDMQPSGIDCYPFAPTLAYYNPELEDFTLRCAGIVRSLRDPQFLFNHRKVLELQSVESVLNAGWIAEENSVVNPDDLYKPQPGQVIYVKKGKMGLCNKIQQTPIDPSWQAASADLRELMYKITNVNETMMGQSTDAISGFHEQMKTATNIVATQRLFDQLDTTQEIMGNITLQMIQNNWTPGKIKRILKENPSREFYDKTFGRYDCQVELGFNTTTQKQMNFLQLMELRQAGINIPQSALVEAATIQNKNKLLEQMQQEGQMEMERIKRQQDLEMAKLESEIKLFGSQSQALQGQAMERVSRIPENYAMQEERKAEAQKDKELGLLHLVKALKEIDSVQIENALKLLQLSKAVSDIQQGEEREKQEAQAIEQTEEGPGALEGGYENL